LFEKTNKPGKITGVLFRRDKKKNDAKTLRALYVSLRPHAIYKSTHSRLLRLSLKILTIKLDTRVPFSFRATRMAAESIGFFLIGGKRSHIKEFPCNVLYFFVKRLRGKKESVYVDARNAREPVCSVCQ